MEVTPSHPTPDPVAPVYGPVLGTTATPEAVGGLGRRVWLLRMARAQRRERNGHARRRPWVGAGGSFRAAVRTATHFFRLPPILVLYCTTRVGDGVLELQYCTVGRYIWYT